MENKTHDELDGMHKLDGMDKLDAIFFMQNLFDSEVKKNRNLEDLPANVWIQKQTLAMISEISELLNEVNFKWWKNDKPINYVALKEELIDILHFFVGMCLNVGMTSEDLYQIYMKKNKENFDRQCGKSEKEGYDITNK